MGKAVVVIWCMKPAECDHSMQGTLIRMETAAADRHMQSPQLLSAVN